MRRLSLDESLMFSGISTKFQHMTNGYFRILMPLILCPTTLRKVLFSLFLVRRGYSTVTELNAVISQNIASNSLFQTDAM